MSSCFMSLSPVMSTDKHELLSKASFGRILSSRTPSPYMTYLTQKSSITACVPSYAEKDIKPSASFDRYPSLWGDRFSSSPASDLSLDAATDEGRIEYLTNKVKHTLLSLRSNSPFQELDMIEKIQRLGVAYHFESEIDGILKRIHNDDHFFHQEVTDSAYLTTVAVAFRLLRQAGYYVSPDVFNKFKDDTSGAFHSNLTLDVHCMLSLYQATYLSFNGEDIMDEALDFTTKYLKSMVTVLPDQLAAEVTHALERPLRKRVQRIEARYYISVYKIDQFRNEDLLELAELDFNLLQSLHRKEVSELLRWWDSRDVRSKLPFEVRDRVVEGYTFLMGFFSEKKYSFGRILLGKQCAMATILDDAFDLYGDLEELSPLTDAFQRWDIGDVNDLGEHMKVIFQEVNNVINEAQVDMIGRGQYYGLLGIPYMKEETKDYTRGLIEESKILFSEDIPTLEEWLPIAEVTVATQLFVVPTIMNMGEEVATKDVFDWIISRPKIYKCSNLICRLIDDIATYKWEHERGIMLSSITSCMKDHGISESNAIELLQKRITSLWKDMNEQCCKEKNIPLCVLNILIDYARAGEVYYADGEDGYTNVKGRTEEFLSSLLINPILV